MTLATLQRALSAVPRAARVVSKRQFSALVALDEEFPGIPATSPSAATGSKPSVSTLPNGLTVVTEDAASSTTVSITYPKAGSASETPSEQGAALFNKCLAFNSGSGMSTIAIMRNIEDGGGVLFSSGGRFGATLGFTCPPENAARLAPLLATDCSFERWDVRDAQKLAGVEAAEAQASAQVVLTENIFAAAFGPQSSAGRPYYCAPAAASLSDIVAFRGRAYDTNGAVLAATGVSDHAAFVKEVQEGLTDSPAGSTEGAGSLAYLGGESRVAVPGGGYAHLALAFDGTSTPTPLLNVLKHIFQLSGAAKGVSAFASNGLVGVYAGGPSSGELADSLTATVKGSGPELIKRAKGLAKAEALFALDGGSKALTEAMTASVAETGTFTGAAGVAAAYDAITDKDVDAAASAMLKETPAFAAVGDITGVPYLGTIQASLA